jgi:adenosylcobyric acid synthase
VLLVGDIDRGGVFAQLYGTVALLDEEERAMVKGVIINKFRGDERILTPGLRQLEDLIHIPVVGVVPYVKLDIDDEDSLSERLTNGPASLIDIAVIRLPRISNFTDFSPLEEHPALGVRYVSAIKDLGAPDLVILPGTKSTMADLRWLRETGFAGAVRRLAAGGTPVLGVCGGYQMLGRWLSDPTGSDGGGEMPGLDLLPITTVFEGEKIRRRVRARVTESVFASPEKPRPEAGGPSADAPEKAAENETGADLSARDAFVGSTLMIDGYEIHTGRTSLCAEISQCADRTAMVDRQAAPGCIPFCLTEDGRPDGFVLGNVAGTYMHGLFDSGALVDRLASFLADRRGIDLTAGPSEDRQAYRERQYDLLADVVREHLDMDYIYRIMGLREKENE